MVEINWCKKAYKQAQKLPQADRVKIGEAVTTLANFPPVQNVKALANHEYGYRLRVGNYRALVDAETEVPIIEIQEVKKRHSNTY